MAIGDELKAKTDETESSTLKEEADQKMAEDMDDIIKLCNEINEHDAKGERVAQQVVEKGLDDTEIRNLEKGSEHDKKEEDSPNPTKDERYYDEEEDNPNHMKEEENKREVEDPGLIDELSQEEDEDDVSSKCKHCGVDMVIETELKKHILLRYAFYPVIGFYSQDFS